MGLAGVVVGLAGVVVGLSESLVGLSGIVVGLDIIFRELAGNRVSADNIFSCYYKSSKAPSRKGKVKNKAKNFTVFRFEFGLSDLEFIYIMKLKTPMG